MAKCGIYAIRNVLTGDRYVGQAVDIERRWKDHRQALAQGQASSPKLQQAWDEYGEDAFVFEILEECSPRHLDDLEEHFLRESCAYNHLGPISIALSASTTDPTIADMLGKIRDAYDHMTPEAQEAFLAELVPDDDMEVEDEILDMLMDLADALKKIPKGEVPSAADLELVQRSLLHAKVPPDVAAAQILPALAAARAFINARQFDQAEALLLQACDLQEVHAAESEYRVTRNTYEALANLYRTLGRDDDAMQTMKRFSEQRPAADERSP